MDQNTALLLQQQQQQQAMLGMGAPSAMLGQSQYPPQYSFGRDYLYGGLKGGGGIGGGMISAGYGLGQGLSSTASTIGMVNALGSLVGFGGIGGASIGGFAGAMMGLNPLTATLMASALPLQTIGGAAMSGHRLNAQVGQALSSANFVNPLAAGGLGYSLNDQSRMSNAIINMGANNAFVNQQSQMDIFKDFTNLGLDKGVTSISKLIDKFKDFSKVTEDMAKQLGKTVSEVTGYVGQLRGQGFYTAREITGQMSKITAGTTYGLSVEQQLGMAQTAAGSARAMGLAGGAGARLSSGLTNMLGAANSYGYLDEIKLLDLYGSSNSADAIGSFGQNFGNKMMTAYTSNSVVGNMMGAFIKKDASGNFVIDQDKLGLASSGKLSFSQIKDMAQKNISSMSAADKQQYVSNKDMLASQLVASDEGTGATLGIIRSMASERAKVTGGDTKDIFKLLMDSYGLANKKEAELLYELATNYEDISQRALENQAKKLAQERTASYISTEKTFRSAWQKFKHEAENIYHPEWAKRGGVSLSNAPKEILAGLERAYYGVETASTGLFTDQATSAVYRDFAAGKLNLNMAGNAEDASAFQIQSIARTGTVEDLQNYMESSVDKTAAVRSDTKFQKDIESNFLPQLEKELRSGGDGRAAYEKARLYAVTHGMTEKDLDYALSKSSRGAAALKMQKQSSIAMNKFSSTAKDAFVNFQSYDMNSDDWSAVGVSTAIGMGVGGLIGAVAGGFIGIAAGGVGAIPGAIAGAKLGMAAGGGVGAGIGGYFVDAGGDEKIRQLASSGVGVNLLSVLDTEDKLKDFDNQYMALLTLSKGDEDKAAIAMADYIKKKYGTVVTPEDVKATLEYLRLATKDSSPEERLKSGDYKKATELSGLGKAYQQEKIITSTLNEFRSSVLGTQDKELAGMRAALEKTGADAPEAVRQELSKLIDLSMQGKFNYTGDDEILKAVADAKAISENIGANVGKDISSLDEYLGGKGMGAEYRKAIGSKNTGRITATEARQIAKLVAEGNVLATKKEEAMVDEAATTAGNNKEVSDAMENIIFASEEHLRATRDLATLVDNIGANMTGGKPYGVTKSIEKKE
jgi:hypothetical protein